MGVVYLIDKHGIINLKKIFKQNKGHHSQKLNQKLMPIIFRVPLSSISTILQVRQEILFIVFHLNYIS